MKNLFEVCSGSIIGRDHRSRSINNQDSFEHLLDNEKLLAVICDGCTDAKMSEVGSRLASKLIIRSLQKNFKYFENDSRKMLERVKDDVLSQIRLLSYALGDSLSAVINTYFLFTIVGLVASKEKTLLFAFGDGAVMLNDQKIRIGPFPRNEPPYLAYLITGSRVIEENPEFNNFQIISEIKTRDLQKVIIGSDGLIDLDNRSKDLIPGRDKQVFGMEQFFEDKYFQNSDMLRRRLFLLNKEFIRLRGVNVEKYPGLLPDDTTVIAIRRKENNNDSLS